METGYAVLTVLFEDPFWAGIYERREGRTYQVCKITFGAEPKSTVPPGDDPSWSEPMDSAPVDQTAEELAKKR